MRALDETAGWSELLAHPDERDHLAHLTRDEAFRIEAIAEFLAAGLALGEAALAIVERRRREPLVAALRRKGAHPVRALRILDAEEVLASLTSGGRPSWPAFEATCGAAVSGLRLQYPGVRAYGELVDMLWQRGERSAAVELEKYWNDYLRLRPFTLLCGYSIDPLDGNAYDAELDRVCRAHSHLIPARDYTAFNQAVDEAAQSVLDQPLAQMLVSLSARQRPAADMPLGQAMLFWLKQNMPRTADKVLAEVRARLA
jgi:hypothetical protein